MLMIQHSVIGKHVSDVEQTLLSKDSFFYSDWCQTNGLVVKTQKCKLHVLLICFKQKCVTLIKPSLKLPVSSVTTEMVKKQNILGLVADEN